MPIESDPVAAECERQERAEAAYLTDEIMEGGIVSSEWIREFAAHAAKCRKLIAALMREREVGAGGDPTNWIKYGLEAEAAVAEFAAGEGA